jgi:hypothetical protein
MWLEHGESEQYEGRKWSIPQGDDKGFLIPKWISFDWDSSGGQTFTSDHFSVTILYTLRKHLSAMTAKWTIVHIDNVRPHRSKVTVAGFSKFSFTPPRIHHISQIWHRALSSSSVYWRIDLRGINPQTRWNFSRQLRRSPARSDDPIWRSDLTAAFRNWEERLWKCIEVGGEYAPWVEASDDKDFVQKPLVLPILNLFRSPNIIQFGRIHWLNEYITQSITGWMTE